MKSLKIAALAASLLAGAFSGKAQTADEIMQKHIDAIGGEKLLNGITTIKRSGSAQIQGMEIPCTTTFSDGKGFRKDLSVMGMTGFIIFTPKQGWIYAPFQPGMDSVTAVPEEQMKSIGDMLSLKSLLFANKANFEKIEKVGIDTVNNEPCFKLKVTGKSGKESTVFISSKTYYMVRVEMTAKVKDEDQEIALNYSNFQKLPEGLVLATTETDMMLAGAEITYKSTEINKPVADDTFKPIVVKK